MHTTGTLALVVACLAASSAFATAKILNINCGGDPFTTPDGERWYGDATYLGLLSGESKVFAEPGAVTTVGPLAPMFNTMRVSAKPFDLTYRLGMLIPGESYTVRMHFADLQPSKKGRVFAIVINGEKVVKKLKLNKPTKKIPYESLSPTLDTISTSVLVPPANHPTSPIPPSHGAGRRRSGEGRQLF